MHISRLVCAALAIVLGVAIVLYGGMDDSPGAQLIGVVVVVLGIVGIVTSRKKRS